MKAPDVWTFVLLALAAFRVYRLVARDTITEPVRAAVSYPDGEAVTLDSDSDEGLVVIGTEPLVGGPKSLRVYLSTLVRCPWCAGFYVSVGWWAAWWAAPHWTAFLAAPWALSGVVALVEKNLDE